MDYFSAMDISATGLDLERTRLDLIALNIANATTTNSNPNNVYRPLNVIASPKAASFETQLDGQLKQLPYSGVEITSIDYSRSEPRKVLSPGHPHADKDGFVFSPDINLTVEMLDLISARRGYEANLKVISAAKTMNERALEIGK